MATVSPRSFVCALAVVASAAAGCADDVGGQRDGGADASTTSGLALRWTTVAPVPGPQSATVQLDELHLSASSLRVVGDAAPADPRTTLARITLEWADHPPPPTVFDQAPAGRYAQVELGISGGHEAFEAHGRIDVGGQWAPFEIEDEAALAIVIPIAVTVVAGDQTIDTIALDVARVVDAAGLAAVPPDALGVRRVTRNDPQIAAVRAAIADSFQAASAAPQ